MMHQPFRSNPTTEQASNRTILDLLAGLERRREIRVPITLRAAIRLLAPVVSDRCPDREHFKPWRQNLHRGAARLRFDGSNLHDDHGAIRRSHLLHRARWW